jgi:hypothetical protein
MERIEPDYLVVGAGAMGIAFVDTVSYDSVSRSTSSAAKWAIALVLWLTVTHDTDQGHSSLATPRQP